MGLSDGLNRVGQVLCPQTFQKVKFVVEDGNDEDRDGPTFPLQVTQYRCPVLIGV